MLKVVHDEAEPNEASGSVLDEIVREAARQMLAVALQAEVSAYIDAHAEEVDENGHRLVVRNGHHNEREVAVSRTTMLAFSALGNTDALATSRRMSRPDIGLAMTPTVTSATSRWRLTRQPLACCSRIAVPARRRRACRLRDTRFRSR